MTNHERIKNMTIEEMALWLMHNDCTDVIDDIEWRKDIERCNKCPYFNQHYDPSDEDDRECLKPNCECDNILSIESRYMHWLNKEEES